MAKLFTQATAEKRAPVRKHTTTPCDLRDPVFRPGTVTSRLYGQVQSPNLSSCPQVTCCDKDSPRHLAQKSYQINGCCSIPIKTTCGLV